jgi:cysteine-rich repeat protein
MMTRSLALLGSGLLALLVAACGDDGNNGSCGDGHVTGSESCDDGNQAAGDGCSANCKVEGTCGNGVFDVSTEQCDDGNMTSGDGCSSTCRKEGTCGNGAVEPGETCDDGNTAVADGCNSICLTELGYTCTGMPSTCTPDGAGGSCSAPSMITLMMSGTDLAATVTGDTTLATNTLGEAECDGIDSGAGKENIWSFTTTDVRDVMITMTPDGDFDASVRMMTAPCDVNAQVIDQVGDDGCSDYGGGGEYEVLGYVNLPAGTYYIAVDGYTDMDAGTYTLEIMATTPGCGDGLVGNLEFCDDGNAVANDGCTNCTVDDGFNCDTSEPSVCQAEGCGDGIIQDPEVCDDDNTTAGDGCSATCEQETGYTCFGEPSTCVVAGCGNGLIETGEECDDTNTTSGDRCSATCVLEHTFLEGSEPNNTAPQALPTGNQIIRGTFTDGDVDLYTFTLSSTAKVEIETYSTINGTDTDYDGAGTTPIFDCLTYDDDPELAVFPMGVDTTMDNLATAIDDDDGDAYCSYLGPNDEGGDTTELAALPAGTYTLRLQPSSFSSGIPAGTRYMIDLKITPAGSAAVAPELGDLKINEFMAADGGSTNGGVDSNCDGILTNSDDEFIELVNVSNKTLDLTGVTYADALGVKFTFGPQAGGSLTLAPNKAVVIWGGGAPACAGVTNFFVNGTAHTLSLNDAGDTITISTGGANPKTIVTTTYAAGTIGKSLNLSPDVTGSAYALHNTVTGAVGNYSPGKKANGSAF